MTGTMAKSADSLRRGWTTGACAAAATRAALAALLQGRFPDPVTITLPGGETPAFMLALEGRGDGWARAGIIKDAGDDPDVTHGCLVIATVSRNDSGGISLKAGEGVGTVTRAGLPVAVGEPAINPIPARMIRAQVEELIHKTGASGGFDVEIAIPGGEELAKKTWNPRLGIVGGLSILGTTGIVRPFSCSAWIAAIHSGIDVARAQGMTHIAGATGAMSEKAVKALYGLDDLALIDMGDFVGGMLKYVRRHPVARVTIAGGMAKMTKLAQGALDLHSGRSQVDFDWLARQVSDEGLAGKIRKANTVLEVVQMTAKAGLDIVPAIATSAVASVRDILRKPDIQADVVIVDRAGEVIGRA